MNEHEKQISQRKAVLVVGLMFAMFIVPYVYILYIYKTGDIPTSSTTEKGVFFKPFINMAGRDFTTLEGKAWKTDRLQGKWALLNIVDENCNQACLERVFNTQQGITALTRYKGRVDQLVLVHPRYAVGEDLETIVHLRKNVHSFISESLFAAIGEQLQTNQELSGHIIIVDPEARLLLWYKPEQSIQEVLRDIKRLLKSSVSRYTSEGSKTPPSESTIGE